jgi:hypothetical protein
MRVSTMDFGDRIGLALTLPRILAVSGAVAVNLDLLCVHRFFKAVSISKSVPSEAVK